MAVSFYQKDKINEKLIIYHIFAQVNTRDKFPRLIFCTPADTDPSQIPEREDLSQGVCSFSLVILMVKRSLVQFQEKLFSGSSCVFLRKGEKGPKSTS